MHVSRATIEQDGPVTDVEVEALRTSAGWDNVTPPFSVVRAKLYVHFVARAAGRLVGLVDVLSDGYADSYLQDLVVHPDFQREGIGTALMWRAIRFLQSRNIKCIQVTFVPELEAFYSRFGFHIFRAGIMDRDAKEPKLQPGCCT